jgi:hypothetical protein
VRLRLDNLFIKQSIFDHHERCVNRTFGAHDAACEDAERSRVGRGRSAAVRGVRRGLASAGRRCNASYRE